MDPYPTTNIVSETEQGKAMENDKKERTVFALAMKGKWEKVIEMYKSEATLHKARLTRAGDTALHIAVSDGKEDVVKKMVDLMADTMLEEARKQALKTQNHRKNTSLHLAASMGNSTMCHIIASAEPSLVDHRNVDGETPLFLAALYGRKQAFLCLHYIRNPMSNDEPSSPLGPKNKKEPSSPHYENCRRNNGDTILHCAINNNYFDLAFQIIHLYKDLANSVNEEGLSPLHLLASKPHSFKSGSRLGRTETIIYHCIFVEKLKVEGPPAKQQPYPIAVKDSKSPDCPENCNTIRDVFVLMKKFVRGKHKTDKADAKDPEAGGSRDKIEANPLFPANYKTCCDLIKFFYVLLLIILGHGSEVLKKIHRKKENHTWSVQIVKELLSSASTYEYENDGSNPYDDEVDNTMMAQGASAVASVKPMTKDETLQEEFKHMRAETKSGFDDLRKMFEDMKQSLVRISQQQTSKIIESILNNLDNSQEVKPIDEDHHESSNSIKGTKSSFLGSNNNEVLEEIRSLKKEQAQQQSCSVPECEKHPERRTLGTPILVAAKNGVMEIIEAILELFPVALHDLNEDKKNIVLLAVEHRQPHVYEFLMKKNIFKESVFRQVDREGNSALHLAAKLGDYKPWLIPGEALQMQWELKWFKFVNEEMPPDFFSLYNMKNETPEDIFTKTHKELVKSAADWLQKTSESCSVVAALIATVAFATAATVPGGVNQDSGHPTLENEPAFEVFAISSLVALGFSITAVVMFLSIMTSRFQEHDFNKDLPRKLLVGFTSLFMSIAAMLVSFCAGHFFVLKDQLQYAALPIYLAACLPVTLFVMAQFPLYFDLMWATFKHVPQRSYRPT